MGHEKLQTGRGVQFPLPGMGPFDIALADLGVTLAAQEPKAPEPFTTYKEFNIIQQGILTRYDKQVLEPQRPMWAFMQELLARGPYTSATLSTPPKVKWRFDHPKLYDIGNGRMAQVRVEVDVTLDNRMPQSALRLMSHLHGEPLIDDAVLLKASHDLGMDIPTVTKRRLGRTITTESVPSKENTHQKVTDIATEHIEQFSASVIATVEGNPQSILYTKMSKKDLEKPQFITGNFRVPFSASYTQEYATLSPKTFRDFLWSWDRDVSEITKDPPTMETLSEFLSKQIDWNPKKFPKFNSILNLISESALQTTIGNPQKR